MCSFFLFSLYSHDLCKYKNCVIKTCFQRGFKLKMSFIKKKSISKEKSETVAKVKLVTKQNQLYFGTLLLASYCYCGDNT